MRSPFPGMDPYIEASHLWGDFHLDLISKIKHALAAILPERYVVRAEERSYVALVDVEDDEEQRALIPDVAVLARHPAKRTPRKRKESSEAPILQGGASPIIMRALVKTEYREGYLEIRQVEPERKLITGIEILSPSNKRPNTKGWRLYYRKRLAYLSGKANFVEIDLLRRGRRMPMASPWPDSPYYLLICRKEQAPRCTVWPASYREPLQPIPIPLAPPDADVSLDIQPLIASIYTQSRYDRDIDYHRPLIPPLPSADAAWLEKRVR